MHVSKVVRACTHVQARPRMECVHALSAAASVAGALAPPVRACCTITSNSHFVSQLHGDDDIIA